MYSDAEPGAPEAAAPKEEEKGGEPTALLSKSVLGGKEFKEGDEVVLKIVKVHDQDVEVAYATEDPENKGESPPAAAPEGEKPGGESMTSMME
jgi:hypothetical protein